MSETVTFKVRAYYVPENYIDAGAPARVQMRAIVADLATAESFIAQLPKSLRLNAATLHEVVDGQMRHFGYIRFDAKLYGDGANGGKNETGIRRYRQALRHLARMGATVEFDPDTRVGNAYRTFAELHTAIGL